MGCRLPIQREELGDLHRSELPRTVVLNWKELTSQAGGSLRAPPAYFAGNTNVVFPYRFPGSAMKPGLITGA